MITAVFKNKKIQAIVTVISQTITIKYTSIFLKKFWTETENHDDFFESTMWPKSN
jgi:hypothetical protein